MAISDDYFYAAHGLDYNLERAIQSYSNIMSIKTLEHLKDRIKSWVSANCEGDSIELYDVYGLIDI